MNGAVSIYDRLVGRSVLTAGGIQTAIPFSLVGLCGTRFATERSF